ncbi:hypothetical protein [Agrococcus sp. SGAir0287]|uniref:hypothetical protein n=1 Tax=Agrococcus sp. SGAir0287 TaxID=2070347 RepID=UPI0010CD6458|nr:hypothetical protein [Agrococcus sp. SGAir0287]QCR18495.1 hypothetical protein C1N71_02705 [Agrococcus sp. SGAir0287]
MSERMPDFAMPSDEELAAERRAEAIARARAADPTSALRDELGLEPEPVDEGAVARAASAEAGAADATPAGALAPPDPATRIDGRPGRRGLRLDAARRAVRRRALAVARNPVVAFAAGAALVAAGFLAAPALTAWTERGSQAELERIVEEYAAAVSEGDLEAVLAFHRPEDGTTSTALLDAGVMPTAPANVTCDVPEPRPGRDVAIARCTLGVAGYGGMAPGAQLRLERIDGAWQVTAGLEQPAWIAESMFEVVAISGVPMADVLDRRVLQYWALPGGYEVETRTSELIELADLGGLVVADGGGGLSVYAEPGDVIVAAAEAAALEFAQACVVDAAAAAACGIVVPPDGRTLSTTLSQQSWGQDATTIGMGVRVSGTGAPAAPVVEVLVRFADDWETYELEVTGVTETYG